MGQLIVRNIEQHVVDALKQRAAKHGRSAEAEHRELLRQALVKGPAVDLKGHLLAMPEVGEDADFDVPRGASRPVDL